MAKGEGTLRTVAHLIVELARSELARRRAEELGLPWFCEPAIVVATYTLLRERGFQVPVETVTNALKASPRSARIAKDYVVKLGLHRVRPSPEKVAEALAWLGVPEHVRNRAVELFTALKDRFNWVTPVLASCVLLSWKSARQADVSLAFGIAPPTLRKYARAVLEELKRSPRVLV